MVASRLVIPGERLVVGCSGGPDSTALLLALRDLGCDVVAAHFDHAMRQASGADARAVTKLCTDLGVPLVAERRHESLPHGSRQAAARQLRYAFYERALARAGAGKLALGHTADDVVEGVLLHLLRGTGLAGLRGVPSQRGVVVRPLVRVWRQEVLAYLRERGVRYLDDPSNRDRSHARVRVRLDLLPRLERDRPGLKERLLRVAQTAAARHEALMLEAHSLLDGDGAATERLLAKGEVVAGEALRQLYARAGGRLPALDASQLRLMLELVRGTRPAELDLPGLLRFQTAYGRVEIKGTLAQAAYTPSVRVEPSGCHSHRHASASRDRVHLRAGPVHVRTRQAGLRMRVGVGGSRKLQDILVDAKVPRSQRDELPLVFANGHLAWVPGLAVAAEFAAEAGGTSQHVVLESAHRPSRGVSA
jgi:tRNA(Ile)-lysidine synthase